MDERLDVKPGGTKADNKVSLITARCIGACSLAPAVVIDGAVQGRLDADAVVDQLERL